LYIIAPTTQAGFTELPVKKKSATADLVFPSDFQSISQVNRPKSMGIGRFSKNHPPPIIDDIQ
jgi:hypothetical protein